MLTFYQIWIVLKIATLLFLFFFYDLKRKVRYWWLYKWSHPPITTFSANCTHHFITKSLIISAWKFWVVKKLDCFPNTKRIRRKRVQTCHDWLEGIYLIMGNPTIEEYFLQNTDWKGIDWNYLAFRFPYLQKLLLGFTFRLETVSFKLSSV